VCRYSGSFAALTISRALPQQFPFLLQAFEQFFFFFVKTQRTPTQTDTTILFVYSLSLVTIIIGHLILTKNSESERFFIFVDLKRQSDSPRKTKRQLCDVNCERKCLFWTTIVEKRNFLTVKYS
jgi:hypothetical protein